MRATFEFMDEWFQWSSNRPFVGHIGDEYRMYWGETETYDGPGIRASSNRIGPFDLHGGRPYRRYIPWGWRLDLLGWEWDESGEYWKTTDKLRAIATTALMSADPPNYMPIYEVEMPE